MAATDPTYSSTSHALLVLAFRGLLRPRFPAFFLILFIRLCLFFVLVILVFLVIEFAVFGVIEFFKCQGFAREPVNGARNKLLFDVLAQLVIELETFLNV